MSLDERVARHLRGFRAGVANTYMVELEVFKSDEYQRGYAAGRAAYLAAEVRESERQERCPTCVGTTIAHERVSPRRVKRMPCPDCGGTGKRRER